MAVVERAERDVVVLFGVPLRGYQRCGELKGGVMKGLTVLLLECQLVKGALGG